METSYLRPSIVTVWDLSKTYRRPGKNHDVVAVRDFSITVYEQEFVTLFGPNGCGKSTLLRVLAGLDTFDTGQVLVGGLPPGDARIGFVFQDFRESLFPWRTSLDNIAFPLEMDGRGRDKCRDQAREFCAHINLKIPLDSYPYQLSGGQQQMVSIARALIGRPKVLLMDEPFSALDYQTNAAMEDFLLSIWHKLGMTILFISHEIDQAIYLASRIALLARSPAKVAEEIEVGLPRPRVQGMKNSTQFIRLRAKALDIFNREVGR